ncbi:MAG TPA: 4'-phosphopantetheinyl transferase superfamily protein [Ktedonobacterales bacterium]|jgi:4'-phosphopantetheinyl transferase
MTLSAQESLWSAAPERPILASDEAHIWRARLNLSASHMQALEQTLAADERQRASQFRFSRDRARFIAARGMLRSILGRYLSREPQTLRFSYNEYGKPALADEVGSEPLLFNLAHSHDLALYAITRCGAIGIDLEQISPAGADYEQIATRFFSPHEVYALQAVAAQDKQEAFLNCWTRKEAYVKARGLGLSLDLNLFDVSLAPGEPAALLATREEGQDSSDWSLHALSPGPGYVAALAVQGQPASLTCWQQAGG